MWQTAANQEKAARLATFCVRRRWVAGGTPEGARCCSHVGRVTYCRCCTCGWNLVLYGLPMYVCVTSSSMPLTELQPSSGVAFYGARSPNGGFGRRHSTQNNEEPTSVT